MSDFAQSGLISTLQQLNDGAADTLDETLTSAAAATPIALILPCRGDDLDQPALLHILSELQRARFVDEIVISANGLTGGVPSSLRERIAALPQSCRIIRSDAPAVLRALHRMNISSGAGKGRNIWLACGLIASSSRSGFIVTQDSDVSSFQYAHLARLCFAATHRELSYTFCKMYYSRAGDRLYGRVSRLFFTPLLHASVRVLGRHPLLDFLSSFRYPLAGESVIAREHAMAIPMEPSWGFELGLLCEMFRRVDPRRVAQIDGGRGYEHRHQPLGDAGNGLFAMCESIARTFFGCLLDEGVPICSQFFDALRGSFAGELREALRRSRHLALINGFSANADDDAAAAVFARAFDEGCAAFLRGAPAPLLPSWNDLQTRDATGAAQLIAAVERDGRSLIRSNQAGLS